MEVFAEIVSFFAAFAARKAAFFMPFFSCCRDSCFLMSFIWLITPLPLMQDRFLAACLHEFYRHRPIAAGDKDIRQTGGAHYIDRDMSPDVRIARKASCADVRRKYRVRQAA